MIDTLAHIVSLYPSLCRPLHTALSNVALRHLNGSAPNPTSSTMLEACSRLYSALPHTGGKVGAAGLWRKALDDTIAFAWGAFLQLRTTYSDSGGYLVLTGESVKTDCMRGSQRILMSQDLHLLLRTPLWEFRSLSIASERVHASLGIC